MIMAFRTRKNRATIGLEILIGRDEDVTMIVIAKGIVHHDMTEAAVGLAARGVDLDHHTMGLLRPEPSF